MFCGILTEALLVGEAGDDDGPELLRVAGQHQRAAGREQAAHRDEARRLRRLRRLVDEQLRDVRQQGLHAHGPEGNCCCTPGYLIHVGTWKLLLYSSLWDVYHGTVGTNTVNAKKNIAVQ